MKRKYLVLVGEEILEAVSEDTRILDMFDELVYGKENQSYCTFKEARESTMMMCDVEFEFMTMEREEIDFFAYIVEAESGDVENVFNEMLLSEDVASEVGDVYDYFDLEDLGYKL